MDKKKFNTGIVLSGGGARGFAHLGVLEALNEEGIFPEIISGTSAGAIAGVLYADGYTPREILDIMNTGSRLDFMRPALPREGLLQISGITKILKNKLRAKRFEDLRIPLIVTATDIYNGKPRYFSTGDLIDPVMASSSIPVLFQPVIIDNICYVDGGVLDNMPVTPVEELCRYLIGSFVNPVGPMDKISGLINIAERVFMLSMSKELTAKAEKFEILVAPEELMNYNVLNPEKAEEIFNIGYKATINILESRDKTNLRSCI